MNGYMFSRGFQLLLVGMAVLVAPTLLGGQTAEELARIQELRAEMEHRLQSAQEERLHRIEEALARAREEMERTGEVSRELRAARLEEIERALSLAREEMEGSRVQRGELLERRLQAETEALVRAQQLRLQQEELRGVQEKERMEARARAEALRDMREETVEAYRAEAEVEMERVRQELQRARQMVVRVRARVRLGVSLDPSQGAEYDQQGARIQGVMEDTPAQTAGLQEGDIITHLNGRSLLEPLSDEGDRGFDEEESLPVQRLMALASDVEAGDQVEVRYVRDGTAGTVTFEATEKDEATVMVLRGERDPETRRIVTLTPEGRRAWTLRTPEDLEVELEALRIPDPNIRLRVLPQLEALRYSIRGGESPMALSIMAGGAGFGLDLVPLNPGLAEYFATEKGLLVLNVEEGSTLGLAPGDVLLAIDGREVTENTNVGRILRSYDADERISFTIVRKGREMQVDGTVG